MLSREEVGGGPALALVPQPCPATVRARQRGGRGVWHKALVVGGGEGGTPTHMIQNDPLIISRDVSRRKPFSTSFPSKAAQF